MAKKSTTDLDDDTRSSMKKILKHPDLTEIINKLVIDISIGEIHSWLKLKYCNPNEEKFVISQNALKNFKEDYLDIYNTIKSDFVSAKEITNTKTDIKLAVSNNKSYKSRLLDAANNEIDLRTSIKTISMVLEDRLGQLADHIQENKDIIDPRKDRLFLEYVEQFGNILEKMWKFTEAPNTTTVNHNISLQVVDKHITVFQDIIKKILSEMNLENSMYFMELFNDEMSKAQMSFINQKSLASQEMKISDVEILNDKINKQLNA